MKSLLQPVIVVLTGLLLAGVTGCSDSGSAISTSEPAHGSSTEPQGSTVAASVQPSPSKTSAPETSACGALSIPNPTPDELQSERIAFATAILDHLDGLGFVEGTPEGRQAFITMQTTNPDEIAKALDHAPPGAVSAFLNHACNPPIDPRSPAGQQSLWGPYSRIAQLKMNPSLSGTDWESATADLEKVYQEHAVVQAADPLALCGVAIGNGSVIDDQLLMLPGLSVEIATWNRDGQRLLCPDQVGP